MLKQTIKIYVLLGAFCFVLISCTKEIDLNQASDFKITPIIESSLIFFNEPAVQFLENGVEIVSIQDEVEITFFDNKFIQDNLIKADFVFETNNSINRAFQVQVDFLNELDQLVHQFTFGATESVGNTNVIENYTETFEGSALMALKVTRKMVFTLSVLPGIPINNSALGKIQLKSKGVFYLNIERGL